MFYELQRSIEGRAASYLIPHSGGTVHEPEAIHQKILYAAKHLHAKEASK